LTFSLEKTGFVTLVIEDAQGHRVRNLVSETKLPAGRNTLYWDGYDDGVKDSEGNRIRHRVAPGRYRLRGLTHDGLHLRYEFSVNSPGTPPWFTADRSGGWMSDHLIPAGAAFIPARSGSPYGGGRSQILLSAILAENGDPIIAVDTDGRQLYGDHFFGWEGGVALAYDGGERPREDVFAYVLFGSEPNTLALRGLTKKRGGGIEIVKFQTQNPIPREPTSIGLSVAAWNGLAAISLPPDNALAFVDAKKGTVLGRIPLDQPKGLWFDRRGRLYAITGKQVNRYELTWDGTGMPSLSEPTTVIASGLDAPYALSQDESGDLFITDDGSSHQVKVFSPDGPFLRVIGKPGGPQLGRYDELRMQRPEGIAVDDRGQVWVAECDALPKRISVWSKDGKLLKSYLGPPIYGGGGTIDAQDPTRFFYAQYGDAMEFALDWKTGTSWLKNVLIRRSMMGDAAQRWQDAAPERPVHINGDTYLVGTYQGRLRGNDNSMIWKIGDDGVAWPVAFVGGPRWWTFLDKEKYKDVYARFPQGVPEDRVLMAWSDLNHDHAVQAEEFQFRVFTETYRAANGEDRHPDYFLNNQMGMDLSMTGAWTVHVDPPTFDSEGIPLYDLRTARFLLPIRPAFEGADVGMPTWPTPDGWLLLWQGNEGWHDGEGWKGGVRQWIYPQEGGENPPEFPGQMVSATRLMGPVFRPTVGEAGETFALNGDKGAMYLMTADGLFLQTLGGDERTHPLLRLPKATRGMLVDGYSFAGEDFHNTITQVKSGEVYLVAGHEHSSIFRLDGLETVKRREFGAVQVKESDLAGLPEARTEAAPSKERSELVVSLGVTAPEVDGRPGDWPAVASAWARFGDRASAALRVAQGQLYAMFRTGDPALLSNAGGDFHYLFKRGGALDLMLGTDPKADPRRQSPVSGDLRLLVTQVEGRTKAVLYRAVAANGKADDRFTYASPVGRVEFGQVEVVSDRVSLAGKEGDFEFSVPLSVLGWAPKAGESFSGDLGILKGYAGQTVRRTYWSNRNTAIVSDVPSEARLQPGHWGRFKLQ
jgi:hypothetical protein